MNLRVFLISISCSLFSDFNLPLTLAVWKKNRYYRPLLNDACVGLGLEYFPEIFQKNKIARIPKHLQLGSQMAANLEMLEKMDFSRSTEGSDNHRPWG